VFDGPDAIEWVSLSDGGAIRSCKRIVSGFVLRCRPCAAGDLVRSLEGASCHPCGVGGIGPNVVWPGLRVGGAEGRVDSRVISGPADAPCDPAPGPTLCDRELLGGGPGGGGGNGMLRPQGTTGDSSIGVLISVP
jgi:hypothetical protein